MNQHHTIYGISNIFWTTFVGKNLSYSLLFDMPNGTLYDDEAPNFFFSKISEKWRENSNLLPLIFSNLCTKKIAAVVAVVKKLRWKKLDSFQ